MDERLQRVAEAQPEFAQHIGATLIEATPERVIFDMPVTEVLANRNGVLHGGAIMGLADNAGDSDLSEPARRPQHHHA